MSYEIRIARDPSDVFGVLANFENDVRWRANVVEMRPLGKVADLGGEWSRQTERRKVPGRVVETEAVITSFVPPFRLAVQRASGPVRPEAIYELSPDSSGGTKLHFRLDVVLAGWTWLLWPLLVLFLYVAVRPALPGDFERLRALLQKAP